MPRRAKRMPRGWVRVRGGGCVVVVVEVVVIVVVVVVAVVVVIYIHTFDEYLIIPSFIYTQLYKCFDLI